MLAATYTAGKGFAVREVPSPVAGPEDVLLRVTAAAICATDLKIMRQGHRKLAAGRSIVLGHEFVGRVEAVGERVTGLAVGARVGVVPNAGCGTCAACRRGRANYCDDYTAFGIDRDGGHAPFVLVPRVFREQGNLVPLMDGLPDDAACLLEPLSCVMNCLRDARLEMGDAVVIYGAGPMGVLTAMAARAAGAGGVLVVEPRAERRKLASDAGADDVFDPARGSASPWVRAFFPDGADVAVVTCPVPQAYAEALGLLAPFGRLCAFASLPKDADAPPLDLNAIHYRNLKVTGTTGGSIQDYHSALRLVACGRIDVTRVIAARFPMSKLKDAYDAAANGVDGKVVLTA